MAEMPRDDASNDPDRVWWRDGVLYQIYPRSYRDTNGDGVGDLRGVIEKDDHTGQWYLNQFLASQPDLNWWNDDVRAAFQQILRFWFDRGIAGFRIDVCHAIVKDELLRDNPPATADDHWYVRMHGLRQIYN